VILLLIKRDKLTDTNSLWDIGPPVDYCGHHRRTDLCAVC